MKFDLKLIMPALAVSLLQALATLASDSFWITDSVDANWANPANWTTNAIPDASTKAFVTPPSDENVFVSMPIQQPNLYVTVDELTLGGSGGGVSFLMKKNGSLTTTNGMHVLSGTTISGGAPVHGNVNFGPDSTLEASVCGCDGVMDISGQVTLGGTLAFQIYQNTLPQIGTSKFVLRSTNMVGEFDNIVNETELAGLKTTTYYTNAGVLVNYGVFLAGDVDVDGTVGFNDLLILAQNYPAPSGAAHYNGDVNHDTAVDFADLLIIAQTYGQSIDGLRATVGESFESDWQSAQSMVPEPSMLGLLAISPMILRRCRTRRA